VDNKDQVLLSEEEMNELSVELMEWGEDKGLDPYQFACLMYHLSLYVADHIDLDLTSTIMKTPIDKVN
jgi:hypothetical protein